MALFEVQPDHVTITADIAEIKEFRVLKDRKDRTRVLAFIYHMCEWGSPYAKYYDNREKKLIEDFLDGKKPDKEIEAAVVKYKELSRTPQIELLEAARIGALKLADYFNTADPSISDHPGRDAKDLMSNLEKVGTVMSKFSEWEEQVKREQAASQVRKGVKISEFNRD